MNPLAAHAEATTLFDNSLGPNDTLYTDIIQPWLNKIETQTEGRVTFQVPEAWLAPPRDNGTIFRNPVHARIKIAVWTADHNTERPHSAFDYLTPVDYARALTTVIARLPPRDERSASRAIAQPALSGSLGIPLAPVAYAMTVLAWLAVAVSVVPVLQAIGGKQSPVDEPAEKYACPCH